MPRGILRGEGAVGGSNFTGRGELDGGWLRHLRHLRHLLMALSFGTLAASLGCSDFRRILMERGLSEHSA